MKRVLSFLIIISIVLSGCASPGSGTGENSAGSETSAVAVTSESVSEMEENSTDVHSKSALEIIEEEERDPVRAVKNRKSRKAENPDAYILRPHSADANGSTVSGPSLNEQAFRKEYTVMVYIVGSNLESRTGAATQDINEMTEAGLDYEKINLLLYTGGSCRWVSDIPNDTNSVLDLSMEPELRIAAQTSESANMGSPETLSEFINYCTRNYPAEHYALILWDHGGGPLWGYGCDELFGNDSLLLNELHAAMDTTQFGPENKLDWVGFDACLMGSIENAVLWKDYADYLVSSEEVEAGRGWDYHFLSLLNESQDAEEIVKSIIDAFADYYEENRSSFFSPDATLSVMDLSKTDELTGSVDVLFDAMKEEIAAGGYAEINQARSRAKSFGLSAVESIEEAYDLIDLRDFAGQLEEYYPEECAAVTKSLDKMVIYSTSNVKGASGVSIYLPGNNKTLYELSGELSEDRDLLSLRYQSFVESYADEWLNEGVIDWHLGGLEEKEGELILQLTDEQVKNLSQAYYSILLEDSVHYSFSLLRVPVKADENGMIRIPADPMLVGVASDMYESMRPWSCVQIDSKDGINTYRTLNTYVIAASGFYDFERDLDERVEIIFRNTEGESETVLQDVISESGGIWNGGKGSVDISDYKSLMDMSGFLYRPKRNEEGEILPCWTWINEGGSEGYTFEVVPVDNSFRFTMRPASAFDCSLACQVVIRDVHDGLHATECKELPSVRTKQIEEEKTGVGTIQYKIFEDHAEVYRYTGNDETVIIPSSVHGRAVTVIGDGAFSGYDVGALKSVVLPDTIREIGIGAMPDLTYVNLPDGLLKIRDYALTGYSSDEIRLPDSLVYIGREAFRQSSLRKAALPASLVSIHAMPFNDCYDLTEITVDENNPNYRSIDGVLYTADGRTLIQYPHGKGSSYRIEDGTTTVAYGAFAEDDSNVKIPLESIEFPDTLQKIENAAFYSCGHLKELVFPNSLEEIGALAFGEVYKDIHFSSVGNEDPYKENGIESVGIGPSVKHIGGRAFSGVNIGAFVVDPDNEYFASKEGFITNKAGDTVLTVPSGKGRNVVVPEGITTLPGNIFIDVEEGKQYYIPDSVFRFAEDVFGNRRDLSEIMIHCSERSAAETFAQKYGIPYDTNNDPESDIYENEIITEDELTLSWRLYGNHAELESIYSESPADVYEVPAEYKGLPVTSLGSDAELDSGLYSSIKKIVIPESIRYISSDLIRKVYGLETIEVAGGNFVYESRDGVLFTKDGTLLRYPPEKKDEEYRIPEGTARIGAVAFNDSNNLKKVIFAASVTEIEDGAFKSAGDLIEVSFNEGLKTIGGEAFSAVDLQYVNLPSTIETIGDWAFEVRYGFGEIVLPDSLTSLGTCAFRASDRVYLQDRLRIPNTLEFSPDSLDDVLVMNYEAEEDHPYHSIVDGLLMSRDKKTLVAVPGQREGELVVPDGVLNIGSNAFRECRYLTDVYLPASVKDVGNLGDDLIEECLYTVHCYEGTPAQQQLEQLGVDWVKR